MKKKKILLLLIATLILSACSKTSKNEERIFKKGLPVEATNVDAFYAIDINNLNEYIGHVDYVFIGRVDRFIETKHLDLTSAAEERASQDQYKQPYSYYDIIVEENIKGDLIQEVPIRIVKPGGISLDGTRYELYEEDLLPEVGFSYLFMAYADKEGELWVIGPSTAIPIGNGPNNPITTFSSVPTGDKETIKKYHNAASNEVPYNRTRYMSIYDVNSENIPETNQTPTESPQIPTPGISVEPETIITPQVSITPQASITHQPIITDTP